MIMPGTEIQVLVATKPVDFRKQADGLAAIVQQALSADPFLCVGRDYVSEAAEGHVLTARA
jgi:IS66 Orf2 like protein